MRVPRLTGDMRAGDYLANAEPGVVNGGTVVEDRAAESEWQQHPMPRALLRGNARITCNGATVSGPGGD